MANRRYSIKFSGAATSFDDKYHDGKMSVAYCYMFANADIDTEFLTNTGLPLTAGEVDYNYFIPTYDRGTYGELDPLMLNYKPDAVSGTSAAEGVYDNDNIAANAYSIYRTARNE